MLGLSVILWSSTSIGMSVAPSFAFFVCMRLLLGSFASAFNPASFGLIADYFPPSYRSTANAIETSGQYIGAGLCGICVILINKLGWRGMYKIIGCAGMLAGLLAIIFIKEPERGTQAPKM